MWAGECSYALSVTEAYKGQAQRERERERERLCARYLLTYQPVMSTPSSSSSSSSGVQIENISFVKPLQATKRFNFYLPPSDTFFQTLVYIRDVLFYPIEKKAGASFDMQTLKHGLSLALVDFYPVAGRLCHDDDHHDLTIDCNDAGVEFVEAVSDHDFCELQAMRFPIHDFYDNLARVSHDIPECLQDAALLSIQVTRFKDGEGIAIGVAASHVAFDGHSLWYFLNAWGQCCRKQCLSLPPFHVRAVLKPECLLHKPNCATEDRPVPAMAIPKPPPKKGYHKVLHFEAATVQQLKQTAIAESGNTGVSSLQAVLASVWKRLIAAHDPPPERKVCMNLKADLRQRLRPALTQAYFGNALETLYVNATAADLKKESLGAVAARINKTVGVLDDQVYIRERLATSKEVEFSQLLSELIQGVTWSIFINHGPKFPVYDVDVGMGRPVAVRPPTIHYDTGVVVYPSEEPGAIDVCVRFTDEQTFHAFLSIASPSIDI